MVTYTLVPASALGEVLGKTIGDALVQQHRQYEQVVLTPTHVLYACMYVCMHVM